MGKLQFDLLSLSCSLEPSRYLKLVLALASLLSWIVRPSSICCGLSSYCINDGMHPLKARASWLHGASFKLWTNLCRCLHNDHDLNTDIQLTYKNRLWMSMWSLHPPRSAGSAGSARSADAYSNRRYNRFTRISWISWMSPFSGMGSISRFACESEPPRAVPSVPDASVPKQRVGYLGHRWFAPARLPDSCLVSFLHLLRIFFVLFLLHPFGSWPSNRV